LSERTKPRPGLCRFAQEGSVLTRPKSFQCRNDSRSTKGPLFRCALGERLGSARYGTVSHRALNSTLESRFRMSFLSTIRSPLGTNLRPTIAVLHLRRPKFIAVFWITTFIRWPGFDDTPAPTSRLPPVARCSGVQPPLIPPPRRPPLRLRRLLP